MRKTRALRAHALRYGVWQIRCAKESVLYTLLIITLRAPLRGAFTRDDMLRDGCRHATLRRCRYAAPCYGALLRAAMPLPLRASHDT